MIRIELIGTITCDTEAEAAYVESHGLDAPEAPFEVLGRHADGLQFTVRYTAEVPWTP